MSDKRFGNVAHEQAKLVNLVCGHQTGAHPVAIFPDRRKMYACPEGCKGLQKAKSR